MGKALDAEFLDMQVLEAQASWQKSGLAYSVTRLQAAHLLMHPKS